MRPRAVKITVGGAMAVIVTTAVLLSLSMPRGPKDGAAIRVARDYSRRIKPSDPIEGYEATAAWNEASRRWEVGLTADGPYPRTLIEIDYATGECRDIRFLYDPRGPAESGDAASGASDDP